MLIGIFIPIFSCINMWMYSKSTNPRIRICTSISIAILVAQIFYFLSFFKYIWLRCRLRSRHCLYTGNKSDELRDLVSRLIPSYSLDWFTNQFTNEFRISKFQKIKSSILGHGTSVSLVCRFSSIVKWWWRPNLCDVYMLFCKKSPPKSKTVHRCCDSSEFSRAPYLALWRRSLDGESFLRAALFHGRLENRSRRFRFKIQKVGGHPISSNSGLSNYRIILSFLVDLSDVQLTNQSQAAPSSLNSQDQHARKDVPLNKKPKHNNPANTQFKSHGKKRPTIIPRVKTPTAVASTKHRAASKHGPRRLELTPTHSSSIKSAAPVLEVPPDREKKDDDILHGFHVDLPFPHVVQIPISRSSKFAVLMNELIRAPFHGNKRVSRR